MAAGRDGWVNLATRIPRELHRRMKLYCVEHEVSIQEFAVEAIQDKLKRDRELRQSG